MGLNTFASRTCAAHSARRRSAARGPHRLLSKEISIQMVLISGNRFLFFSSWTAKKWANEWTTKHTHETRHKLNRHKKLVAQIPNYHNHRHTIRTPTICCFWPSTQVWMHEDSESMNQQSVVFCHNQFSLLRSSLKDGRMYISKDVTTTERISKQCTHSSQTSGTSVVESIDKANFPSQDSYGLILSSLVRPRWADRRIKFWFPTW